MEYISDSLEKIVVKEQRLDLYRASHYFIELLKALKIQEENALAHLNLKLSNLFIIADIIKISDSAQSCFCFGKQLLEIPEYCAPEFFDEIVGKDLQFLSNSDDVCDSFVCNGNIDNNYNYLMKSCSSLNFGNSVDRWAASVIFFYINR